MSLNEKMRATLRQCGEPMSMEQLADANGFTADEKKQACKNLYAMKNKGEIKTSVAEGRVHYELVSGFVPYDKKSPASVRDKTPKAIAKRAYKKHATKALTQAVAATSKVGSVLVTIDDITRHTRSTVLKSAHQAISVDRQATHGAPEKSFADIAGLLGSYLRMPILPHDVAALMALFKLARIRSNPTHGDNWVDLAGYAACGAEVAGA